jgi:hypothetical protein
MDEGSSCKHREMAERVYMDSSLSFLHAYRKIRVSPFYSVPRQEDGSPLWEFKVEVWEQNGGLERGCGTLWPYNQRGGGIW